MHISPQVGESNKFLLVESVIRNPGLKWNPEYNSKNSESLQRLESRIQVPLTDTGIQYQESGIRIVESRIQHCLGFRYMEQNKPNVTSAVYRGKQGRSLL